jgi:hypothetical protein
MNELSPAGISLLGGDYNPGETEEERRKRLAAIEAQKNRANAALSPAGRTLAARGYGLGAGSML